MDISRTQEEIDEQRELTIEAADSGRSAWPGMSYEQGVEAALAWIVGDSSDAPMSDE